MSAILTDADGNALYYGRLANDSEGGTVGVAIPAGLPVGSYTLKVLAIPASALPQTGDDSRAALWVVLMGACCAGLLAVYRKKRRTKA